MKDYVLFFWRVEFGLYGVVLIWIVGSLVKRNVLVVFY